MESRYQTLRTIYTIVKDDPQPTTYPCRPRELILRLLSDWSIIKNDISSLEEEGLVATRQLDTFIVMITQAGIERMSLLLKGAERL